MSKPQWSGHVGSVVLTAAGLFFSLCLLTYTPADVPLLSHPPQSPPGNLGGTFGVWIGFIGRGGFGWAALLLPAICWLWAWRLWRAAAHEFHGTSFAMAVLALLSSLATGFALFSPVQTSQVELGGIVGFLLANRGTYYLGTVGTVLAISCVGLLSWVIVSGQTLRALLGGVLQRAGALPGLFSRRPATAGASFGGLQAPAGPRLARPQAKPQPGPEEDEPALPGTRPGINEPKIRFRSTVEPKKKSIPTQPKRETPGGFQLPSMDMLTTPPPLSQRQITDDLQQNARILEATLQEFGIEARVVNIERGPAVTRYELTPAAGVKLNKIVSLADDLALVMKAASVHVIAPIPGKGTIGVDVPNSSTTTVYLKEIITAHEFASSSSPIALPIGKDISGQAVVTDLRDCPHLLIAGATGSGKTVCLNAVLMGILMHASPEQVKFLMVDPKMVELAMFNNIPHLVAPVVTNPKKASVALHWAVEEMERRYELLSRMQARKIDEFNKKLASGQKVPPKPVEPGGQAGEAEAPEEPAEDENQPLPYLVIVIDELADLMMVASQDVEGAITRLAQLSRAVGIHIIMATQRPSVDVITGVIKANFPARIAFQVASKVDSRTILDANGADKLLGRGDLMFLKPGAAKPLRAQGVYVTDAEIETVTNFLKQQRTPTYNERLLEKSKQPEGAVGTLGEKDELYETAKQLVLDTGQASTSLLQRRLRLGYGRAARILDLMEQEGIIGPPQGSRPREILISREASK